MLAAELLDATSAAILRTAGLSDDEAKAGLAVLWGDGPNDH
jgi:hypothetical protein